MYSPQIIENYQLQSGEGLSVGFILIWLVGDLCNLSGAILAGLLPTIIILGVYVSHPVYLVRQTASAETPRPPHSTPRVMPSCSLKFTTTAGNGHAAVFHYWYPKTRGCPRYTMKQVRSCGGMVARKDRSQSRMRGRRP